MKPDSSVVEIAGRKIQLMQGGLMQGGKGAPVLYLHSAAGESEWSAFHAKLAEQHRVLFPMHPGFAFSGGLESIQDITDLAWHYVDLIEKLAPEGVSLVGFSLGGWIAAELAILRPQLVQKMVLVASAGVRVPEAKIADLFDDDLDFLRETLFAQPDSELARRFFPTSQQDERMLFWIRAREATARVAWNPLLHNPRLPGHLHRITCPTLVLWGELDRLFPLPIAHYFQQHIRGARLEVLPQCGHMLPLERPEDFTRLTTEFLAG
ncbi:MAG: hypothetical protein RIS70_1756 [Planctomycetota bacterium]|jgi:pimeloyl-ACP methyl ester carboxylesterase